MYRVLYLLLIVFSIVRCDYFKNKIYDKYRETVQGEELTDESVVKYIKTVKALHKFGQNLPQNIAETKGDPVTGIEGYSQIESIIKENGFDSFAQFVKINAKVAWAWNVAQGDIGIQKYQSLKDAGTEQLQSAINNPDVPEETKVELRKSLAEIEASWQHNKKYADMTLNFVRPLTNEKDMEIIKKHQKELMEAYTGRPIEELVDIDPKKFITETMNEAKQSSDEKKEEDKE